MKNTIINKTQSQAIELLNNKDYFSRGNKRFFNIYKTVISGTHENSFFMLLEKQGEFIQGTGTKHNVLKLISKDGVITVTGGFEGEINGQSLYNELKYFFNNQLGYYEKGVLRTLTSIEKSKDYKNTWVFNSNNNGFYLTIDNAYDIRVILHK